MAAQNNIKQFRVFLYENWRTIAVSYFSAADHKSVSNMLPLKSKRVHNKRYREIETTGKYYMIECRNSGGQTHIYELV